MTHFFYGMAASGLLGILFFGAFLDSAAWLLPFAGAIVSGLVLGGAYLAAVKTEEVE